MECSEPTETFDDSQIKNIAKEINSGKIEITSVLVKLKNHLTDSEKEKRANGMHIFSSILAELDDDACNEDQIKCLSEYFSARLSDKSLVIEKSVPGLEYLCHFKRYNFELASTLFFTIQNEQPIRILSPDYKFRMYRLIQYLFERFHSDFVDMNANFVYGFLRIVDSETSPTCLTIIFEMFQKISAISQFEPYFEDIFDSMACYFPIIYSSLKKDKYFETKMLLSDLLNQAMTANSQFSQYVIPLVLEKLDSESEESKISCYRLLQMALPKYRCENVKEFLSELWVSIRIDTLKPQIENDDLAKNALATLTKLVDVISTDKNSLKTLMEKIWTDLEISLKSPELELTDSSAKILIACSSENKEIFNHFFQRSHPILMQNFLFNTKLNVQKICLEAFFKMIEHGSRIKVIFEETEASEQMTLLMNNGKNKSKEISKLIIMILNQFIHTTQFENKNFLSLIVYYAINSVEQSGYDVDLKESCLCLISSISQVYPDVIDELFLTPTMENIDSMDMIDEKRILFLQELLRYSCQTVRISKLVIDFLTNRYLILKKVVNNQIYHNIALNLMETFEYCLRKFHSDPDFIEHFHENCVIKLLKIFVKSLCSVDKQKPSQELVDKFAQMFHDYFCFVHETNQNIWRQTYLKILNAYLQNDFDQLFGNQVVQFNPDEIPDEFQEFLLLLIYSCLRTKPPLEPLFFKTMSEIFSKIVKNSLPDTAKSMRLKCMIKSQIVFHFLNQYLDHANTLLQKELDRLQSSDEQKYLLINSSIWICKSLFKVKHHLAKEWAKSILDHLDHADERNRKSISQIVDVIYSRDDFWQTFYSNENLTPMDSFLPELHDLICEKFSKSNNDPVLLYILLSHLKFMPNELINKLESEYFLRIFEGLETKKYLQEEINILSLTFLQNILETNPNLIEPQVITVLRRLIEMANQNNSLIVRKKSLDIIIIMIDLFGEEHFLKLKNEFVQNLRPTLADHKRVVRSSAVKSFFKMTLLGQPGNKRK